jgi:CheY-like chemotaxis protein
MGGSMSVCSQLDVGTSFNLCLEFGIENGAVEQHAGEMEASVSALSGLKLLLVEDDYVNLVALEKLLSKYGFTTEIAEDGKQALEKLTTSDFDLVLMDVQMPVMDGVEAVRAIRNGEAGKDKANMPVIALTAHAMAGDKEKFMSAGMDGYLPKPLDERELMLELTRVIRPGDEKRN